MTTSCCGSFQLDEKGTRLSLEVSDRRKEALSVVNLWRSNTNLVWDSHYGGEKWTKHSLRRFETVAPIHLRGGTFQLRSAPPARDEEILFRTMFRQLPLPGRQSRNTSSRPGSVAVRNVQAPVFMAKPFVAVFTEIVGRI